MKWPHTGKNNVNLRSLQGYLLWRQGAWLPSPTDELDASLPRPHREETRRVPLSLVSPGFIRPPRWVRATGTAPPAPLGTPGNHFLRSSVSTAPVGMQCQYPNLFSISSYFALKWMLSNCLARSLSAYTHYPSRQEAPCPRLGTTPPGRMGPGRRCPPPPRTGTAPPGRALPVGNRIGKTAFEMLQ